ncbi:winged helix-turn-helix domain-containing protein [Pseudoalteromonas sp. C2R02]|uniref:winged helix-turn-helix domain-containing protein n=1 Tax=Pseudoalteromonas sp. C2R02 TaxID=2841565 RepID=UPI001C09AABE|nr:winged helix-turn-helix domain-containing protein [Pseudoalteromonas sp. C2R02]MBU2972024.1 winged helix-turn-helix domain-containing protein [Pseudoalteromonas sp. C2R02]
MRYTFNNFEFNTENLLLTHNDQAITIRHTEAKVLAVFLENQASVLNKEDILSYVWSNKVVSEQVVFQNISHLRQRFGNDAIKTFPKRGYQWQIKTLVVTSPLEESSESSNQAIQTINNKRLIWPVIFCFALLCILIASFYSNKAMLDNTSNSSIKLAFIPIKDLSEQSPYISFEDDELLDFTELSSLKTEKFENAISIEYPKIAKAHRFILMGKMRTHNNKHYLDFKLKGPSTIWQGQISGSSRQDVISQLTAHLKHKLIYDLISSPQAPEVKLAKLSIAHQKSPNDLIILRELSMTYFMTDEFEKAMALADKLIKLAKNQNNFQHLARALAYQSKVLTKKGLFDLSAQKLSLAKGYFNQINDLKYLARAWYYQSWLDHQNKNYDAIKTSLIKSSQLAFKANNKLGGIESLIHLASMAHTYQQDKDKYLFLQQAETKLRSYNLPSYHFALISYRYASFAKTSSEKEPHLKKVLELTTFTPEHWAAQSSKRQLVNYYLSHNRINEAQKLIDTTTLDNATNSYLKALLAQAQLQTDKMVTYAKQTFEQAQLSGSRTLSLDSALLLCNQDIDFDYYSQYINNNATAYWRTTNATKLNTINL